MSEVKRPEQLKLIDKFHAHLDVCPQCEKHPFDLCPTGAKLLKEAATYQNPKLIKQIKELEG